MDIKKGNGKVEAMQAAMSGTAQEGAGEETNRLRTEIIDEVKRRLPMMIFVKLQFQVGEIIACEGSGKGSRKKLLTLFPGSYRKPGKTDCERNAKRTILQEEMW